MAVTPYVGIAWSHQELKRAKRIINHLLRVLERAPGAELLEPEDWQTLHRNLSQARVQIDKVMDVVRLYPAPPPLYGKEA